MSNVERVWKPSQELVLQSNITALQTLLGVKDYEALLRTSLNEPETYWRTVLAYCQTVWSRDFDRYADLSRGNEFPKWFPEGELNWVDSVLAWADRPETAQRNAVVAERESGEITALTFPELRSKVRSFAAGLQAAGIQRGDRVGLLMEGGIEATVSLLAVAYIGAIVVPLFSGFGAEAIISRLDACSAKALIATTGFHRRGKRIDTSQAILEAKARLPGLERLILKGEDAADMPGALDWADVAATPDSGQPAERMSPNDPFMVIFTSGTTGKPKGAVHTHGGFPLKVVHDSAVHLDARPGDTFLWPVDMGWVGGAMVIAASLLRGATLVCYDGAPDFPDWSRMARLIERHRVTHFGVAPTLIRGLAANPDVSTQGDLSSIRILVTAGEAIDPETFLWHQENFGGGRAPLINFTGGTEASGALLSSVIVRPIHPAGFNAVPPGVEIAVVGPSGEPVVDAVGELAILRPFVGMTQSFWRDDERYLETYWRTVPGLWIHGDLALQTSDGHFFMRGRSDDTLKLAGKRLGPAEVEDVLLELDAVKEAAAIGVDDATKGQKLVVFVVVDGAGEHAAPLEQAIAAHVEQRLGRPFRPARVHIVGDLPKTRTTKVMRRMIRSAYCGLPVGDTTALANPSALDEVAAAAAGT
ncbi:AMP-binding protein [Azospirillum canadense]|uniref:AMP-binding protein n=1 Tax=Azospirillum canadense TaxID=403962 RepID=UPI00222682CF|nr:AMP-binding protein [Azospirillum canadense]MCW2241811.1 acetyl-CoA synthetase [Azospirillum canadense]